MAEFGGCTYSGDREATIAAYAAVERGYTEICGCIHCRNFIKAREQVFPQAFLQLLNELGIDATKEAETYHNARLSPGKHNYAGWFHFIGSMGSFDQSNYVDFGRGFTAYISKTSALKPPSFGPAIQLEFQSESVPWVLDEPEPN
jgi:hypothetical protein